MTEAVNIFEAGPIEGRIDIAELAGSDETSAFVYDIGPGAASCPSHYEYVEEWLLVVAGEAAVRTPDGESPGHLHQGDQLPTLANGW